MTGEFALVETLRRGLNLQARCDHLRAALERISKLEGTVGYEGPWPIMGADPEHPACAGARKVVRANEIATEALAVDEVAP